MTRANSGTEDGETARRRDGEAPQRRDGEEDTARHADVWYVQEPASTWHATTQKPDTGWSIPDPVPNFPPRRHVQDVATLCGRRLLTPVWMDPSQTPSGVCRYCGGAIERMRYARTADPRQKPAR